MREAKMRDGLLAYYRNMQGPLPSPAQELLGHIAWMEGEIRALQHRKDPETPGAGRFAMERARWRLDREEQERIRSAEHNACEAAKEEVERLKDELDSVVSGCSEERALEKVMQELDGMTAERDTVEKVLGNLRADMQDRDTTIASLRAQVDTLDRLLARARADEREARAQSNDEANDLVTLNKGTIRALNQATAALSDSFEKIERLEARLGDEADLPGEAE